ncbi:MAG TPA: SRPBCC domain-containing protein [Gemmatimonadales bacterium]
MATKQGSPVTLRLRRTFQAPRERVFRAWTEPSVMVRWKAPGEGTVPLAEVDLRVGGAYRVHMRGPDGTEYHLKGTYRVVDPPKKLVYTWLWETNPEMGETVVTVEFRDVGGSTELVLTHELFPTDDDRKQHETGWTSCFEKLAQTL